MYRPVPFLSEGSEVFQPMGGASKVEETLPEQGEVWTSFYELMEAIVEQPPP